VVSETMPNRPSIFAKWAAFFAVRNVPDWRLQEAERAWQRYVVCWGVSAVWFFQYLSGHPVNAGAWYIVSVGLAYPLAAFVYRRYLLSRSDSGVALLYVFLVLDPFVLIGLLIQDPGTFAFLNPFLIVTIVRTGLRYGLGTMYLSWTTMLVASGLLATSSFWRSESELAFAFLLMLLFVPVFFASLIRRIHNVRAIEADRAKLSVMHEAVLARSSFVAKLSHELRSPLQGIVSALDVLAMRRGAENEADDELISRIRRSSLLLNTHLRDLLTLANGEAGRLEIRPEPFDVCSLVESVRSAATELALKQGLELVVDLPPAPMFVVADSARVDQILTNLVFNSVRYTDVGQVRISLAPYDNRTRLLRFTVSDTGPGIPGEVLPTLLIPDKAVTGPERRGEGSGIGLAIVRTLMDHLGGRIEVTSQVGRGTTFTLAIPAAPVDPAEIAEIPLSATGRVLVVDDREDVIDALVSVIDELGFECDQATSAAVGANLLASRSYDAVLLDLQMPNKSGADLAAETRRGNGLNHSTRFIGISAAEVTDAVKRQFDACLAKPIEYTALRQALLGPGHGARPSQPGLWSDNV
jgi:signal transduction histidine kinase/ActR/RegA family two-component response regulator